MPSQDLPRDRRSDAPDAIGAVATAIDPVSDSTRRRGRTRFVAVVRQAGRFATTPPVVLTLAVVIACGFEFSRTRRLYFFGDDWDFLLARDLSPSSLLTPHGEHWVLLPVVAFRIMVAIFGIGHYPAYAMMPIVVHAAICGLLYLLLRRYGVPAWHAVIVVVPFAFLCGDIAENPLWDFQIGFLGATAFGLAGLLCVTVDGRRGVLGASLATMASLMCVGIGVIMLLWIGMMMFLTRGWLRALATVVPPAIVYAVWYLTYGVPTPPGGAPTSGEQYVTFVGDGLGSLYQGVLRITAIGGPAIVGLALVAGLAGLTAGRRALAVSGMVAVLVMYLTIGLSRAGFGSGASTVSRYGYVAIVLTLPAAAAVVGLVADRLAQRRPAERVVAAAIVVVLLSGNGVAQTAAFADHRVEVVAGTRSALLGTPAVLAGGGRLLGGEIGNFRNPAMTVDRIRHALANGDLRAQPPTTRQYADAAARLQLAASSASFGLPTAGLASVSGTVGTLAASGCSHLVAGGSAVMDLPPGTPGSQIQVRVRAFGLTVALSIGRVRSAPVQLPISSGELDYIATTSPDATLHVTLPRGPLLVCR